MIKRKSKGFSLVELLIVSGLSTVVLIIIYQLNRGSLNMFLAVKQDSDTLETRTPAVELLSRYFERWGTAVIVKSGFDDSILPPIERFISAPPSNTSATSGTPIRFYANLGGFGFVQSVSGTTANLISCRLNDSTIGGTSPDCYTVFRSNTMLPDPGIIPPSTDTNVDSISLPNFTFSTGKECVDKDFIAQGSTSGTAITTSTGNSTITASGTGVSVRDSTHTITPVPGTFTALQAGDMVFKTPYKVEIYVDDNTADKDPITHAAQKWLYVRMQNVASNCNAAITPEPIAPANSVKAEILGTAPDNLVRLTIEFRSETKIKGRTTGKTFIVRKIFGGV